ncbi:MAG: hypothetical protein C4539_05500 [Ignavibacteriales bacterium]|nr:MAG: hypothetical protein C4539_05500 [Ignavibacteriales bacterium]
MSRYSFKENSFGKHKTIILQDNFNDTKTEVCLRGATLINFFVSLKGKSINILDGYLTPEELEEQAGARSCIMAPYSNRIKDGRFTWQDETLQLVNAVNPNKDVIHGFARVINFDVKNVSADDEKAELVLFTDKIRNGSFPGYPFNINLTVRFTLMERNLDCVITAENIDSVPVPFGCGWHPYFKLGEDGIDSLYLEVPANKIILLDDKYVPLKGKVAYSDLNEHKEIDFRSTGKIGERTVNVCYTDLIPDKDGITRTYLTDKEKGLCLVVYQEGGVTYAFTADTVKYRTRKSIALEPVQFMTDAFNRSELLDEITVKPGDSKSFRFGIEIKEL